MGGQRDLRPSPDRQMVRHHGIHRRSHQSRRGLGVGSRRKDPSPMGTGARRGGAPASDRNAPAVHIAPDVGHDGDRNPGPHSRASCSRGTDVVLAWARPWHLTQATAPDAPDRARRAPIRPQRPPPAMKHGVYAGSVESHFSSTGTDQASEWERPREPVLLSGVLTPRTGRARPLRRAGRFHPRTHRHRHRRGPGRRPRARPGRWTSGRRHRGSHPRRPRPAARPRPLRRLDRQAAGRLPGHPLQRHPGPARATRRRRAPPDRSADGARVQQDRSQRHFPYADHSHPRPLAGHPRAMVSSGRCGPRAGRGDGRAGRGRSPGRSRSRPWPGRRRGRRGRRREWCRTG